MSKFNDLYNLIMEEILNEDAILFENTIITEATEQVTQVVRFLYTCSQTRDLIEAALDNINDNIMKPFINVTCFQHNTDPKHPVPNKKRTRNDNCNIYLELYRHAIYGYIARKCLYDLLPIVEMYKQVLINYLKKTSVHIDLPLENKQDRQNYQSYPNFDFVKIDDGEIAIDPVTKQLIPDNTALNRIQEELTTYTNYCKNYLIKMLNKIVTSKRYGFHIVGEYGKEHMMGYKCLDKVNKIIVGFDVKRENEKTYQFMITNTYPQKYDDARELAGKKYFMKEFEQTFEPKEQSKKKQNQI